MGNLMQEQPSGADLPACRLHVATEVLLYVEEAQDTYLASGNAVDYPMLPREQPVDVFAAGDGHAELRKIKHGGEAAI